MRLNQLFLGAVAVLAFAACNPGQPKIYRIALDRTPEKTIADPSCYRNSQLPSGKQISEVNYREDHQFVLWDGVEGKQYLDIGTQTFKLGNSPTIVVSDMIEGADKVFSAQRNETGPFPGIQATETRQTLITITFNDLGANPTGTMALKAQYACIAQAMQCPNPSPIPDSVSCQTQLNFVGRRIDTSQISTYSAKGS